MQIFWILVQYLILLFSLSVHECAHAWTADRCGDSTARLLGRMTLNPLSHIDPIGTVLFPGILMISSLFGGGGFMFFGWAKPVPVNPRNLRRYPRDDDLVSLSGVFSNFALALIAATTIRATLMTLGYNFPMPLLRALVFFMQINVLLGVFNLIPIPPLDGSHLLRNHLPMEMAAAYRRIEPYGFFILILFLMSGCFWTIFQIPLALFAAISGVG